MVPWAHLSQYPEQHHDQFSHFCRPHGHDWQDRQTDRQTRYAVCSNRPHL